MQIEVTERLVYLVPDDSDPDELARVYGRESEAAEQSSGGLTISS